MNKIKALDDFATEMGSGSDKTSIERRNARLVKFFQTVYSEEEIMVIGDPNKPTVIHFSREGKTIAISCYVHNFTLIFTDAPFNGQHVHSIALTEMNCKFPNKESIRKLVAETVHREVYRIRVKGTDLYLSGYNFKDKTKDETKYPVFAPHGMKIYFNRGYAQELVDQYGELGLEIC